MYSSPLWSPLKIRLQGIITKNMPCQSCVLSTIVGNFFGLDNIASVCLKVFGGCHISYATPMPLEGFEMNVSGVFFPCFKKHTNLILLPVIALLLMIASVNCMIIRRWCTNNLQIQNHWMLILHMSQVLNRKTFLFKRKAYSWKNEDILKAYRLMKRNRNHQKVQRWIYQIELVFLT